MNRRILPIVVAALLACAMSAAFNPFSPYMPMKSIDYKLNWSLGGDSTSIAYRPESFGTRAISPLGLIATSALLDDYLMDQSIVKMGSLSSNPFHAANTTQYIPAGAVYLLKVVGVEGRSDWPRLVTSHIISTALMVGVNNGAKYTIQRERPDGSAHNSYPSGHTATAFMCAQLLHKEYGETVSPWISVGGYGLAASTGIMRVMANRHWVSDILCGAALGILSAEVAYDATDLIFGSRGLLRPINLPSTAEPAHWRFALSADYTVSSQLFTSRGHGNPNARPACSVGMNATWLPCHIGPTLFAGVTQMRWSGEDKIYLPDGGSVADVYTVGAGIEMDFPLFDRLSFNLRGIAGYSPYNNSYSFVDLEQQLVEWTIPNGLHCYANGGLTYRTSGFTSISLHGGLDYYDNVWRSYVVGGKFNFTF